MAQNSICCASKSTRSTDVGSLTPHLGGGSFRYDPLPASLVSQRRRLRFVYFDGDKLRPLTFLEVRTA